MKMSTTIKDEIKPSVWYLSNQYEFLFETLVMNITINRQMKMYIVNRKRSRYSKNRQRYDRSILSEQAREKRD